MARRRFFLISKKKIIAVALITSLGTMGAGYASWNDGLNLTTDISTVNMDIRMSPEYHCRWYRISIGSITGVAKIKVDVVPRTNEINVEVIRLISDKLSRNKEYVICIPFYITNEGTVDVDNYLNFDGGEDEFLSSPNNDVIAPGESRLKVVKVDIMKIKDGKAQLKFKPSGVGKEFLWQEEIDINIDRRTLREMLGLKSTSKSRNIGLMGMPLFKSAINTTPSVFGFTTTPSAYGFSTTPGSLNYFDDSEEYDYENSEVVIKEIDEEEGQALMDRLMNERLRAAFISDTNTTGSTLTVDRDENTTKSSISSDKILQDLMGIFSK